MPCAKSFAAPRAPCLPWRLNRRHCRHRRHRRHHRHRRHYLKRPPSIRHRFIVCRPRPVRPPAMPRPNSSTPCPRDWSRCIRMRLSIRCRPPMASRPIRQRGKQQGKPLGSQPRRLPAKGLSGKTRQKRFRLLHPRLKLRRLQPALYRQTGQKIGQKTGQKICQPRRRGSATKRKHRRHSMHPLCARSLIHRSSAGNSMRPPTARFIQVWPIQVWPIRVRPIQV